MLAREETWRPIAGYVGRYEVSDHGRVRSLLRNRVVILKPAVSNTGYLTVGLWLPGSRVRRHGVASLVLGAFVEPRPSGLHVLHSDGNKLNNQLSNLRWGTPVENMADRERHGHDRSRQVACLRGHELSGRNVIPGPSGVYSRHRHCWSCKRARDVNYLRRRHGVPEWNMQVLSDMYYGTITGREGVELMASKTTVVLVSDLTNEEIEPGEGQTVDFGLDGVWYAADLFNDQADELREVLAPYIAAARRVGGRAKRGTAPKTSGGGYSKEQLRSMREWARNQGMEVSDRGRLPGNVVEAWEKAHQGAAA